jgi:hypothetical protein
VIGLLLSAFFRLLDLAGLSQLLSPLAKQSSMMITFNKIKRTLCSNDLESNFSAVKRKNATTLMNCLQVDSEIYNSNGEVP